MFEGGCIVQFFPLYPKSLASDVYIEITSTLGFPHAITHPRPTILNLSMDKLKELLSIEEIDDTKGPVLQPGDLAKLLAYVKAGAELQITVPGTSDSGV